MSTLSEVVAAGWTGYCGECQRRVVIGKYPDGTIGCWRCGSEATAVRNEKAQLRDIWADGPDSEAARAARGESESNRQWLLGFKEGFLCNRLREAAQEAVRLLEECPTVTTEQAQAQKALEYALSQAPDTRRTPDPDHVPAVRRVVAWDGGRGLRDDVRGAYVDAAYELLERARKRRPSGHGHAWPGSRVKRLADALRHRDEEAGHR